MRVGGGGGGGDLYVEELYRIYLDYIYLSFEHFKVPMHRNF